MARAASPHTCEPHSRPRQFDPVTRAAKDPIWIDPVPLDVLCKGRVNATWCPGEDDEGEGDENEDDDSE